ncbi:chlorohydrolase family protein [Castellaniella sp. GW247-6E4]|uniref:chlorohydrolase family protein n=1 Tax=Castellaniella sp. GW247-6E4 TaxID=3140380 RepID=UPI003315F384
MKTLVKAGWLLAYENGSHVIIRDGELVYEGSQVLFAGKSFSGPADRVLDARGKLVSPGFIDTHVHAGHRAVHRLMSDCGRPEFLGQPFYELMPSIGKKSKGDPRRALGREIALQARYTVVELLRNGVTTFVEFGAAAGMQQALVDEVKALGLRAYLGPGFDSGTLGCDAAGRRSFAPYADDGQSHLDSALAFIEQHQGAAGDRIRGILVPRELDTCSPELLGRANAAARERGLGLATHAAYNPWEVYETIARHGCTPIELLDRIGMLRPGVLLGHCNYCATEGRMHYPGGRDLDILAASGACVSHCPINLMRRGRMLDHWGKYRSLGIPIALGSDTYPRDMVTLMRAASYMGKMASADLFTAPASEVYTAATITGADALGREDLGRLCAGAKADFIIIDFQSRHHLRFAPLRDPVRALVECGFGDDVETVVVDGRVCMEGRAIPGFDMAALLRDIQEDAENIWDSVEGWDPLGRGAAERQPYSFPMR